MSKYENSMSLLTAAVAATSHALWFWMVLQRNINFYKREEASEALENLCRIKIQFVSMFDLQVHHILIFISWFNIMS